MPADRSFRLEIVLCFLLLGMKKVKKKYLKNNRVVTGTREISAMKKLRWHNQMLRIYIKKNRPRVESHYTAPGCWAITRTYARPGGTRVCVYYVWLFRRQEHTLLYACNNDTLYTGTRKRIGADGYMCKV